MPGANRIAWAGLIAAAGLAASAGTGAADLDRGRGLYEQRCTSCHDRSVHGRPNRVAADFGAVRDWVRRWSRDLGLAWSEEEIDDVAVYLNDKYYRFPCPRSVCPIVSMAPRSPGPPAR